MRKQRSFGFAIACITAAFLSGCGKGTPATAQAASGLVITLPNGGQVGCVPLNQAIPFSGSGIAIDPYYQLMGGAIPNGATYGSMTVGMNAAAGGTTFTNTNQNNVGTIQVSVQNVALSTTTAVSGSITLSSGAQQWIQNQPGASYNATPGALPCVSGLAIQGLLSASGNVIGGNNYSMLYLYLNGTTHGVALPF